MSRKWKEFSGIALLKWAALFAVAFVLSLPVTAETGFAANNYTVTVASGYLALRNAKAYDSSNEIGELYTGDTVDVTDSSGSTYWTVYSPKHGKTGYVNRAYLANSAGSRTVKVDSGYLALGKGGYVNKNYLQGTSSGTSGETRTVSVSKGYLALRNAKAYDSSNEIGELYTGDTVQLIDTSDATYWYVYSPKLGKNGFVNKNYLTGGSSSSGTVTKTVSVSKGYLALRSTKAYDAANEIGELYTGDTVQVTDTSDSTYWYVYSPKLGKSGYVNKDYLY